MGYRGIIDGFNEFPKYSGAIMTAFGKADPAKVLVVGTGVAGLQAIATATSMGAIVKATDVRLVTKKQAESLGAEYIFPEEFLDADFSGEGGYAKPIPPEFFEA